MEWVQGEEEVLAQSGASGAAAALASLGLSTHEGAARPPASAAGAPDFPVRTATGVVLVGGRRTDVLACRCDAALCRCLTLHFSVSCTDFAFVLTCSTRHADTRTSCLW